MYAQNYQDEDGYNTGVIRPMDDIGAPKWDITLTLLFSWIVVYLCVLKGWQNKQNSTGIFKNGL